MKGIAASVTAESLTTTTTLATQATTAYKAFSNSLTANSIKKRVDTVSKMSNSRNFS